MMNGRTVEIVKVDSNNVSKFLEYLSANGRAGGNESIYQLYPNSQMILARIENGIEIAYIALADEQVVGVLAALCPQRNQNWTISLIHVKDEYRHNHIATDLLNKMELELSERAEVYKINATVNISDKHSIIFYVSKDFIQEGLIKSAGGDDVALMGKLVNRK